MQSYVFALALACAVALCSADVADSRSRAGLDRAERSVVDAIDRVRASHGLPRLRVSGALNRAAGGHSRDLVASGSFSHNSSSGRSVVSRMRRFTRARRVGETIAYVPAGARDAAASVVAMWMGSASHRRVLLSRGFARVGLGRSVGTLRGTRVAVYTADFASRR